MTKNTRPCPNLNKLLNTLMNKNRMVYLIYLGVSKDHLATASFTWSHEQVPSSWLWNRSKLPYSMFNMSNSSIVQFPSIINGIVFYVWTSFGGWWRNLSTIGFSDQSPTVFFFKCMKSNGTLAFIDGHKVVFGRALEISKLFVNRILERLVWNKSRFICG